MRTISFDHFQWPQNPAALSVTHARQMREQLLPTQGSVMQDLGKKCITVTGEGVFYGERAQEQFDTLRKFYEDGTVGTLRLLGLPPVMAKLVKLELVGRFPPDKIGYRFTFWEESSQKAEPCGMTIPPPVHVAVLGENLWHIAYRYHTTVDVLRRINPQIQWPCALPEGCRVVLP